MYQGKEFFDSKLEVGPHSDIYALGITFVQILEQTLPVGFFSIMQVAELPKYVLPESLPGTNVLLLQMLANEPEDRPPSSQLVKL